MALVEDQGKTNETGSMRRTTAASAKEQDSTLESMRAELDSLKQTVSDYAAAAGNTAVQAVKDTTAQIGSAAADLADSASAQAKTMTTELERIGRANPLGAIAGALLVGALIGMLGRGRS